MDFSITTQTSTRLFTIQDAVMQVGKLLMRLARVRGDLHYMAFGWAQVSRGIVHSGMAARSPT
jgi:hypothetical protein